MHFHFPSDGTLSKYEPLTRQLSTDELFATQLYVSCPDEMVPKLLKIKKYWQEQFRENKLADTSERTAIIEELRNETVTNVDDVAVIEVEENEDEQIVRDILDEILDQVEEAGAAMAEPLCHDFTTPRQPVLSRDERINRQAEYLSLWQDNGMRSPSSANSSPYAYLTEREQKLLAEIEDSKLDEEEEIFAKIRYSLLSKSHRESRSCAASIDGSWFGSDCAILSPCKSFRTSTPNSKSPALSDLTDLNESPEHQTSTITTPPGNDKENIPIKPTKVNVKVNITKILNQQKKNAPAPVEQLPSQTAKPKNFILENIRKVSMKKAKTQKIGAVSKTRPGRAYQVTPTKSVGDSASIRPFMKAQSSNGSPNLWISVSKKSNKH